jgi:hypothetical protein
MILAVICGVGGLLCLGVSFFYLMAAMMSTCIHGDGHLIILAIIFGVVGVTLVNFALSGQWWFISWFMTPS